MARHLITLSLEAFCWLYPAVPHRVVGSWILRAAEKKPCCAHVLNSPLSIAFWALRSVFQNFFPYSQRTVLFLLFWEGLFLPFCLFIFSWKLLGTLLYVWCLGRSGASSKAWVCFFRLLVMQRFHTSILGSRLPSCFYSLTFDFKSCTFTRLKKVYSSTSKIVKVRASFSLYRSYYFWCFQFGIFFCVFLFLNMFEFLFNQFH